MWPNERSETRLPEAPPERVYRAFLDPQAMVKWLPPHGFTATVHSIDVRVGGGYRMSFTNFTTGKSHSFGGKYLEIKPNEWSCIVLSHGHWDHVLGLIISDMLYRAYPRADEGEIVMLVAEREEAEAVAEQIRIAGVRSTAIAADIADGMAAGLPGFRFHDPRKVTKASPL